MVRATLISYFDVWGNAEEGWEINNLCKEEELEFDVTEAALVTDEMILAKLIEVNFFHEGVTMEMVDFADLWPYVELSSIPDGYKPECRLEFQE